MHTNSLPSLGRFADVTNAKLVAARHRIITPQYRRGSA
jgi:hypothetical protein